MKGQGIPVVVKTKPCPVCGKTSILEIDRTGFELWQNGTFIQQALPNLSADEREMLLTGTHPDCWDAMWDEDEDEEEEDHIGE